VTAAGVTGDGRWTVAVTTVGLNTAANTFTGAQSPSPEVSLLSTTWRQASTSPREASFHALARLTWRGHRSGDFPGLLTPSRGGRPRPRLPSRLQLGHATLSV